MRSGRRAGRTTGSAYYDELMLVARPLRYYDLGDSTLGVARNHVGQSGSNATYVGAEAADYLRLGGVPSGPRRAAHDFDGSSEVIVATDLPQSGLTRLSMGAWIKTDSLAAIQGVIACVHDTPRRCEMFIRATGFIDVVLGDGTTSVDTVNDGTAVVVGVWTLVGFSWDGATVRRYLQGRNTGTNASWAGTSINTATRPLYYGGRNNAGTTDIRFDGLVSHAFISGRNLTAGEWNRLYLAGRSRHFGVRRSAA